MGCRHILRRREASIIKRSNIHLIGRLDKETSGILGIAKNSVTAERLIRQRKTGVLVKEYLALGKRESSGERCS